MDLTVLVFFLLTLKGITDGALFRTNTRAYKYFGQDVGEPLFLTKFVESGNIEEGQQLSRVLQIDRIKHESYSGYFTVNEQYSSNMFFWFWPAQNNAPDAPVLLWLQGGPGGSSLFGMFSENGPYFIDANYKAQPREYNWNTNFSLLYIDNPVGTGYSFTKNDAGYAENMNDVARDLYSCLVQFFTLFPVYAKNDFYLTGESYAGKYIPAIGNKIHMENPSAHVKINLKGASIGDGFTDPYSMISQYPDYIFSIGMFDENEREYFRSIINRMLRSIEAEQWMMVFQLFDMLMNGDLYPYSSYFTNVTGSTNYDNYLRSSQPKEQGYYEKFVASTDIRRAIHVGNLTYNDGKSTEKHLMQDMFKSEKADFTVLINNYRMLVYNGQLDIIVAPPLTEAFLQILNWKGSDEYKNAKKQIWRMNASDVSGYVRNVEDFFQVIIRGGGHILPFDQPARCLDMLTRFIFKRPFSKTL